MRSRKSPLLAALCASALLLACGDVGVPWRTDPQCLSAPPIASVTPPRAVPGEFVDLHILFDGDVPQPLRLGELNVVLAEMELTPAAKSFADARTLQLTILVPKDLGPGPWRLVLLFPPNEVCADTAVPETLLARAPTEGKTPAPSGTGFCCPAVGGGCSGYRPGGWVPNETSRCHTVVDARPVYTESTDAHGCRVLTSTASCL